MGNETTNADFFLNREKWRGVLVHCTKLLCVKVYIKVVLGRVFLYCVYDAKKIIHIIQRRQHGLDHLDGTGGKKTLPYLLLLPLKK